MSCKICIWKKARSCLSLLLFHCGDYKNKKSISSLFHNSTLLKEDFFFLPLYPKVPRIGFFHFNLLDVTETHSGRNPIREALWKGQVVFRSTQVGITADSSRLLLKSNDTPSEQDDRRRLCTGAATTKVAEQELLAIRVQQRPSVEHRVSLRPSLLCFFKLKLLMCIYYAAITFATVML